MAVTDVISFEIEGFDVVIEHIKNLASDIEKKREIQKILRRQAKPAERILKAQAPRADRTIKYHWNKSIEYKPGNLKRSIKMFNGVNREYPSVYVGAQIKKPEGSGYYGYFVQYGTSSKAGPKNKNNYVEKADNFVSEIIGNNASGEVARYIKNKAKRLGFVTV